MAKILNFPKATQNDSIGDTAQSEAMIELENQLSELLKTFTVQGIILALVKVAKDESDYELILPSFNTVIERFDLSS